MHITQLIEKLKAMPEKMEGINSKGELVVLNTHNVAEELKKSLRNCDVGSSVDQVVRHKNWCTRNCDFLTSCRACYARWALMPYEKGGAK